MSAPLILTTTHRALDGHGDDLRADAAAYVAFVAQAEPGLVALSVTSDAQDASVTFRHVFEDATAADEHLTVASGHIADSFAIAETAQITVIGDAGPRIRGLLAANREAGVPVESLEGAGGFSRR